MKASEFVHDASLAGPHFPVIPQDVREELLSVKSRPQHYLQDSSPYLIMTIIRGINTPSHAPWDAAALTSYNEPGRKEKGT